MYRHRQGAGGGSQRPAWGAGGARATSPEPGGGTPAVGSGAEGGISGERGEATTREEHIVQLEKENQELKSVISLRDQRIAELTRTDIPAARLKKDARALASEVRGVRGILRERYAEITELKEKLAKQEKENVTPSREGDGHLAGGEGTARLTAEQTARLAEQEEQIRKLSTHVDELLQQRTLLQNQVADREQQLAASQRAAAAAAAAEQEQSISPVARGVSAAVGSGAVAAAQPVSRSGSYTAPVEDTSDEAEMVVYSSKRTEHAASLGRIHLQGFGMVDGASHVAKVLLSRIQSSVYSQQRQQPAAQPQMQMNMAPGMQAGMTHVQMQQNVQYVGGGYPHMQ